MRTPTDEERARMEEAIRAADFAKPFVPARGTSWLGFTRLRSGGGAERDLLLGTWTRVGTGLAVVESVGAAPRLRPRPPAERGRRGSPWDVELAPVQRAAVALPAGQAALILGEAGCGKTTVALHRLAWLAHRAG